MVATWSEAPTDDSVERIWLPTLLGAIPRLEVHQQVVAAFAMRLVERTGYHVPCMFEAAMLHDIGRMAMLRVTDHPHRLTALQRHLVELHTLVGARIAASIGLPREAILAIRHHHERWDGTGYPDGLRGEEIPVGGRVLAVADAVVSMVEQREYNGYRSVTEVSGELQAKAARQFDPTLADAAVALVQSFEVYRIIAEAGRY